MTEGKPVLSQVPTEEKRPTMTGNKPVLSQVPTEERRPTMTGNKPVLSQVPSEGRRSTMTENKPVLSRVPSVQSLHLPLHGVRKEDNRYSNPDPIQELRGILERKDLNRRSDPDLEIGRAL